jgi:hypothetical protein
VETEKVEDRLVEAQVLVVEVGRERQARRDPADRPPEPDAREMALILLAQTPERDRIAQAHRGHVEVAVKEEENEDRDRGRRVSRSDEEKSAQEMRCGHHAFGREVTVGELSEDEWSQDRAETVDRENPADRFRVEFEVVLPEPLGQHR